MPFKLTAMPALIALLFLGIPAQALPTGLRVVSLCTSQGVRNMLIPDEEAPAPRAEQGLRKRMSHDGGAAKRKSGMRLMLTRSARIPGCEYEAKRLGKAAYFQLGHKIGAVNFHGARADPQIERN